MKNVCIILSFLFFALGCSHDDVTTPLLTDAPPVNHAKSTKSPNAREGCDNYWCAIQKPSAYESLFGKYERIQPGSPFTLLWYTAPSNPNFGYFPLNPCQNLRIQLYGPSSANYPLVHSVNVVNNTDVLVGSDYLGRGDLGIPVGSPYGWYMYKIEWDAPNGGCASAAVDVQVVPF